MLVFYKISFTRRPDVTRLSARIAKDVPTDTTVVLTVEESEVLATHRALGHFLVRYLERSESD